MASHEIPDRDNAIAEEIRHAPGTELLLEQTNTKEGHVELNHIRINGVQIVLVPQPSNDPNDPLNWSTVKKAIVFANGIAFAFFGSVTGPLVAAGVIDLTVHFEVTIQKLIVALGTNLLSQGAANILWMPFAVKFGRRPVYLLSNLLMMVALIWLGFACDGTYTSFLLGRLFLGIFQAPIESIVPCTITDMFFLHNRGAMVSIYGMFVLGGNEIGPMLSGFIIQHCGVDWAHWIFAIAVGVSVLTMFLFMPETKYTGIRPDIASILTHQTSGVVLQKQNTEGVSGTVTTEHLKGVPETPAKRKNYRSELAFWGSNDRSVSFFGTLVRPFILLAYPTVVWGSLMYGMGLSWMGVLASCIAQLFSPPPYSFEAQAQGLLFLSALVGSILGAYIAGPLTDKLATYFTARNDGIREPEMRLPICAVGACFSLAGALVLGYTLKHQTHWMGPAVGIVIVAVGSQICCSIGMNYTIDCHKELSVELMVTVATLKSIMAWQWSWYISNWLIRDGPVVVFMSLFGIHLAVYLVGIVFWLKGKQIRTWIHQKDFLRGTL